LGEEAITDPCLLAIVAEISADTEPRRNLREPGQEAFMKRISILVVLLLVALPVHGQVATVWIDDLTWPEVRDAIEAGKRTAIIYVGSSERNGPHMVIGKHNFIARALAQRIAEELGDALVYPTLPYAVAGT